MYFISYSAQHKTLYKLRRIQLKPKIIYHLSYGILKHTTINWFEKNRLIPKRFSSTEYSDSSFSKKLPTIY